MTKREQAKVVYVGDVAIGGSHPIAIESMTNTDTRNIAATVDQIKALEAAGCEIIRVAVPDEAAAAAIRRIKGQISIPLIADIHFDYRMALLAVENGADKLRINPGNIGDEDRVRQVVNAAKAAGIPIRVGVNGGSLEKDILAKYGGITPEGLAESAIKYVRMLEAMDFDNIVVSAKASSAPLLIGANIILAQRLPYPLHIGLTEAGTPFKGAIRSSVGLGVLLNAGLGNTIRVSLCGDPVDEIYTAKDILTTLELRRFGVKIIACPMCGRTEVDVPGLASLAQRLENRLAHVTKPLTVAVMGCAVNGPGEARDADVGIACGKGAAALFKKGKIVRRVDESEMEAALFAEVISLAETAQTEDCI